MRHTNALRTLARAAMPGSARAAGPRSATTTTTTIAPPSFAALAGSTRRHHAPPTEPRSWTSAPRHASHHAMTTQRRGMASETPKPQGVPRGATLPTNFNNARASRHPSLPPLPRGHRGPVPGASAVAVAVVVPRHVRMESPGSHGLQADARRPHARTVPVHQRIYPRQLQSGSVAAVQTDQPAHRRETRHAAPAPRHREGADGDQARGEESREGGVGTHRMGR